MDLEATFAVSADYGADFSDVKGQEHAKRALEVAAAGGHNILLLGPPGSGKTMPSRLPTILPTLSLEEAIDTTRPLHCGCRCRARAWPPGPSGRLIYTISDAGLIGGISLGRER